MKKQIFKVISSVLLAIVMVVEMIPTILFFEASAESVCDHEYSETPAFYQAPTCEKYGYFLYGCIKCGMIVHYEAIAPLGHDWEETGETAEVSCTTDGGILYRCEMCGTTKGAIAATGHNYVAEDNLQDYKCTKCGEKCTHGTYENGICTECGKKCIHSTIDQKETIYCASEGYRRTECTECGKLIKEEKLPAIGHEYSKEPAEFVEPTCDKYGYKLYACIYGCGYLKAESLIPLGHDWKGSEEVEIYICSVCGVKGKIRGTCGVDGNNLDWFVDLQNDVLVISGQGYMLDYTDYETGGLAPWYDFRSSIKKIIIKNGIANIGDYAFYNCYNLTGITIPDSVASIGNYAFGYCRNLNTIIYCGIEDGWDVITKGTDWNSDVPAIVQIHNYVDGVCSQCGDGKKTLGDANGDQQITNADVLMIYRYIYNATLYPLDTAVADVNKDGNVTNADVLAIYRYIYNPTLYPIG